jgi:PAS domain S-box-containing protein
MESAPKVNILIVDDRPENLLAMEASLECPSYTIIKARSGEQAIRYVSDHDFAVILLDVQMPGLDGFETANRIKAMERSRHIPIIFMSAIHRAHQHIFKGYSAGGVDYLSTPYDPEILRSKVEVFVRLYRMADQLQQRSDLHEQLERRQRYRNLSEAMPVIVWTARRDGSIDHINKQWRHYTGMTFEESSGWQWTKALHPDELQPCLGRLAEAIQTKMGCEMRCRLKKKDGTYRWHLIRIVPEKNRKGEIVSWFGTAMNVQQDEELEKSHEEKRRVVA